MKNKKKQLSQIFKISSLGLLGLSTPISLLNIFTFNKQSNENYINENDYKSNERTTSSGTLTSTWNGMYITDEEGNKVSFSASAVSSDGIGIGPRGYLILNAEDGKYYYIGYDGKVIWKTSNTFQKSIYVDYNDNLGIFVTVVKDSNGLTVWTTKENGNGSRLMNYWGIQNLISDFSNEDYEQVIVTRIQNSNGYYILSRSSNTSSQIQAFNFFIEQGNKNIGNTGTNNTEVVVTYDGYYLSRKTSTIRSNGSGPFNTRILAAGALYGGSQNVYSLVTLQHWTTPSILSINLYKNESYQNDHRVLENVNNLANDPKFQVSQIYTLPWNNDNSDFVVPFNISGEQSTIIRGAYKISDGSKIKVDNISWQDTYNTIDYDGMAGRLYKNTFYLFGSDWTGNTEKRNRLLRFKASKYNDMNQSSFDYRNNNNDTNLTRMFQTENIISNGKYCQFGIFPQYTSSDDSFNQNINMIGINDNWSNRNSIVVYDGNNDGYFAYKTTALTNSIITLTGWNQFMQKVQLQMI